MTEPEAKRHKLYLHAITTCRYVFLKCRFRNGDTVWSINEVQFTEPDWRGQFTMKLCVAQIATIVREPAEGFIGGMLDRATAIPPHYAAELEVQYDFSMHDVMWHLPSTDCLCAVRDIAEKMLDIFKDDSRFLDHRSPIAAIPTADGIEIDQHWSDFVEARF